ncbi:multidrug effflux MFS transporter [Hyphomicrobium sp. 99]|uniref:multidrug effflux MFS transporter n=1 Tax=Hyphomicrobium sp. 99 TaxID=1163419 RepID=UPI0006986BFB|nr:multidrug effflux MFS transporter [Hyphomicrobium sp. 99]
MTTSERETRTRASRSDIPANPLSISLVEFVGLIAALMAITALAIDIMLPALPQIASTFGIVNENERQLVVILYMAGFALGQIFFGPLSDHLGRKPVLMAGLAIFILSTIGAILAGSFETLLLARVMQGVGAASPRIIAVAVVRDLYSGRQMARVMSFAMMVFIMIPVFAPSVGQAVVLVSEWRWIFIVLLVMAAIAAIWSGMRLPETARPALGKEHAMTLRAAFMAAVFNGQTAGYGAAGGFMFGCLLAYVASAQQVFVGVFGMGDNFPVVFGALASAIALASFANARLVGRLGMRLVSHTALFAFIGVSVLLAAAAALGAVGFWIFAIAMGFAFFLFGLIAPNFNSLAMEPQGHNAGMASSVVGSLSTAIGAIAGGIVAGSFDGSIFPIAAGFAACSIIAGLIVLAIEGPKRLLGRNRPA